MSELFSSSRRCERDWVYVSLTVVDGERQLQPTHVAFDRILFEEPPHLKSAEVEIILVSGTVEDRRMAAVLAHDPEATRIPIRLLPVENDGEGAEPKAQAAR